MKILLMSNTDWYLYNFRLDLAEALRARGDEVTLASPGGEYVPQLQALGFRWLEISISRRGLNPLEELATIFHLWALYRREKPDIVNHYTIKCVLYGSLAARLAGVPRIINSIEGLGIVFSGRNRFLQTVIQWMYRLFLVNTTVIFLNPDDFELFLHKGLVAPESAHLIPGSGVDVSRFSSFPEPDFAPSVVVFPARLLWEKGVGDFVESARLLKQRGVAARFALIGEPDPHNPSSISRQDVEAWVAAGVVEAWGWRQDMPAVYAESHIVCLPSFYREGVPRSLTEAAASGRAIVTTDAPGCREVVRHGVNGLLVPPRDPVALADALQTLLENPQLRQEMGQRGREIVEREFSSEIVIEKTLKVYGEFTSTRVDNDS
jgi:glycosyltransferase involved in cell wall biosynthesis